MQAHPLTHPQTKLLNVDKTRSPTYEHTHTHKHPGIQYTHTVFVKPMVSHLDGTTPADGMRGPWIMGAGCAPLVAKAGRFPGTTAERPGGSGETMGPIGKGFLGTGGLGGAWF